MERGKFPRVPPSGRQAGQYAAPEMPALVLLARMGMGRIEGAHGGIPRGRRNGTGALLLGINDAMSRTILAPGRFNTDK